MSRLFLRLERLLWGITSFSGGLSGLGMVAMILLIFANMLARYIGSSGSDWASRAAGLAPGDVTPLVTIQTFLGSALVGLGSLLNRAGAGSVWAQELELYLMAFTVMTGFAYAMRHDDHVRIDVISAYFTRAGKLWLDSLTMLLVAIPTSLLILFYAWPYMAISYVRGEGSPNAGGMPWLFLPKAMILVGFALVLTEAMRQLLTGIRRLGFHYRRPRRRAPKES